MRYRIERIKVSDLDERLVKWLIQSGHWVNDVYGHKFEWAPTLILRFAQEQCLWIAFRHEKPVGFMAATLVRSIFDSHLKILRQELLFAESGSLAAGELLKVFIDFGKANANHILTTIGEKTNIKGRSLEKLGFKKLQEMYRIEV